MTYEQFWEQDVTLVKFYREADKLRRERVNQQLWIQGAYIYEVICDLVPVLHAFAKKGSKPTPYRSTPFPLSEEEAEVIKKKKEVSNQEKMKAKMEAFMKINNQKYKEVNNG